jgi:acetoin utilization deacetylase AcuC-like enzyme
MTLLYRDPLFLEHDTGHHPEQIKRLRYINAGLEASGLAACCTPGAIQSLTEEQVLRVHTPEVVARVKHLCAEGGGLLEADTVVSARSFAVALAAAGTCAAAASAVLGGADTTALCLVRPPGHHATPDHSMGFCLFNNIALAARHAIDAHGLSRVLVVDWDVHHGNGTQDIFYEDGQVFFLSVHRYGHGFYPGTGGADETGSGRGLGCTRNVPVPFGITPREFREQFTAALERAADQVKPELILLSAGFDAHRKDPVGGLCLEAEDFGVLTRIVRGVARVHCGGRLVSCLEGGYHLEALRDSVGVHLRELLGEES